VHQAWIKEFPTETVTFMGSNRQSVYISKELRECDYKDIGDFGNPETVPGGIDQTLIVNSWDPHSVPGNGNGQDNSLDGQVGRRTMIALVGSPITNPFLNDPTDEKGYLAVPPFPRPRWHIKVMSYNVAWNNSIENIEAIAAQVLEKEPDIVCFQEVRDGGTNEDSRSPLGRLQTILTPMYPSYKQGHNVEHSDTMLYVHKDHKLSLYRRTQEQPGHKSERTNILACGMVRGQPVLCSTAHLDGDPIHTNEGMQMRTNELSAIGVNMDEVGAEWARHNSKPETNIRKLYIGDTNFTGWSSAQLQNENDVIKLTGFVDLWARLNFHTDADHKEGETSKTFQLRDATWRFPENRTTQALTLKMDANGPRYARPDRVLLDVSFIDALYTDDTSMTILRNNLSDHDGLLCTLAVDLTKA
jgi:endonuclease/exonuclease/phosphatase family metal-dependent hydrolase